MTAASTWGLDRVAADALVEMLGWAPEDGPARLAEALPEHLVCGSTAKLAAMSSADVPPGADAAGLVARIVDGRLGRWPTSTSETTSPAWSCWVLATVMAGLLEHADVAPVQVAAVRRVDDRAPVVDFHSTVLVHHGPEPWVCDPYFGAAIRLPAEPGVEATSDHGVATLRAAREPDGRWLLHAHHLRWEEGCSYRVVSPSLDRGDVHALCAVSATLSGVPFRNYARLHVDGDIVDMVESSEGTAEVRRSPTDVENVPTWADAVDVFADWTGVRIT